MVRPGIIEVLVAIGDRHPTDFLPVDPDDRAIVAVNSHEKTRWNLIGRNGEAFAEINGVVVVPHISQQGDVIAVAVSDGGISGEPGGIFEKGEFAPRVDRIGSFAGALAIAPVGSGGEVGHHGTNGSGSRTSPRCSQIIVEGRMDEFHGGSRSAGRAGPGESGLVIHPINFRATAVEQAQVVAFHTQVSGILMRSRDAELRLHRRDVFCDYEIGAGIERGAIWEDKVPHSNERPSGQINRKVTGIV